MEISFIGVLIYEITVSIQVVQVFSFFLANTQYIYKINLIYKIRKIKQFIMIISFKIKIFSKNY